MVAVVVAIAPLSVVAIVGALEIRSEPEMQRAVASAAAEAGERLLSHPDVLTQPDAAIERVARRHQVRLRVLDPTGAVISDADDSHTMSAFEDLLLGGDDQEPELMAADQEQGPIMQRAVAIEARREGTAVACETWASGTLRVCQVAQVLRRDDGEVLGLIYSQQAHRRAIRALYDLRFALLKLTVFVALGALGLGWWLGWRMVRPLHRLRAQALDQVQAVSPEGLDLQRDDEIGDVAAAFNRLLEALRDRARQNEAFVADLAHEFKNPVAAIQAAAESLAASAEVPPSPERTERLARVLRDSSRRLDALVTQFLELARAEAGMEGEDRDEVQLGALVRGVVQTLAAQEEHVSVRFEHEITDVTVQGVAGRLETAVRNLVQNAASFAGEGGRVLVRLQPRGEHARLEVQDDGPGIAPEDQPRVFDRFFTRRTGRKGTGLGLALVRAIAQAHGGRASVRSTPGQGSTFVLVLPRRGGAAQSRPAR